MLVKPTGPFPFAWAGFASLDFFLVRGLLAGLVLHCPGDLRWLARSSHLL